jgi:GT2 family glycosyltransferase
VTIYDNKDNGGFAGAVAVGQPEAFRCAYDRTQGQPASESG